MDQEVRENGSGDVPVHAAVGVCEGVGEWGRDASKIKGKWEEGVGVEGGSMSGVRENGSV